MESSCVKREVATGIRLVSRTGICVMSQNVWKNGGYASELENTVVANHE